MAPIVTRDSAGHYVLLRARPLAPWSLGREMSPMAFGSTALQPWWSVGNQPSCGGY